MSKLKHKTKYNVGAGVHLYFITSTIQPSKYILSCLQQLVDMSTANINPLSERMYIIAATVSIKYIFKNIQNVLKTHTKCIEHTHTHTHTHTFTTDCGEVKPKLNRAS